MNSDLTTLICLFHSRHHAGDALEKILKSGVPEANVTTIGLDGSNIEALQSSLAELNVPEKDLKHLQYGLDAGGAVLSVAALSDHVDTVESIFHEYASKIDEVTIGDDMSDRALPLAGAGLAGAGLADTTGQTAIPIVEEEMTVGKRTVDAGGVRVYRRVVEIPVEQDVTLREEHAVIERRPVDRAVTDADLRAQGDRVIELTETAEEAVVGKSARVVEEVIVGKQAVDHVETVSDTVRRTEVEVEDIAPSETVVTDRANDRLR